MTQLHADQLVDTSNASQFSC